MEPTPESVGSLNDTAAQRKAALFEILYLLVSLGIYVLSLFQPFAGLVLGVVFLSWGTTNRVRRMGKTCMILGIVNLAVILLLLIIAVTAGGVFAWFPFSRRWGGI